MKIVGRDSEIELVKTFVREAAARGGALVLSGEPGVGKSALLREGAAVARAAGTRVLSGSGTEFESGLSYSTVGQVLLPAFDAAPALPPPQRLALEVALGWADGPVPSPLLFRAAVTGLLRAASAGQPLLIVVDDLQWADRASAEVLMFVARRLEGSRAGFLAATRDRGGLPAVEIQPLDEGASAELLAARFPGLAPRVRERLLADARGNPLALLELPVPLTDSQRQARTALPDVLPLTTRLLSTFAARVEELPDSERYDLLLVALDGSGTVARFPAGGLASAEAMGLVRLGSPVEFRHPLARSAVVDRSPIADRRRAHGELADLAHQADLPEQRAMHLAEAAPGPDEDVAVLLEDAAHRKLRKGDSIGAVHALLRAADLSPNLAARHRRMMEAAFVAANVNGGMSDATTLVDAVRREGDPDMLRTAITAAYVFLVGEGDASAAHRIVRAALGAAQPDDEARADATHVLMLSCWFAGRPALWDSCRALLSAEPDEVLRVETSVFADPAHATDADLDELDRLIAGLSEETDPARIIRVADAGNYVDRAGTCRPALRRLIREARDGGAVASGINAMMLLAGEDVREGLWDEATELADEGLALSDGHGYRLLGWLFMATKALLAAGRGDIDEAAGLTAEIARCAAPYGTGSLLSYAGQARALAAIGAGDFEEAYRQATAISPAGEFPRYMPHALRVPLDLVEAAIRTGRHEAAAAHVAAMRATGLPRLSPRLALITEGAAAMVSGEAELFETALAVPGAGRWPFELARIRLAYAEHLRRARAIGHARAELTITRESLRQLGAAPWTARADSELRATGRVRVRGSGEPLSPREQEIATLAASGLTNKEIGGRLYMSPRTVSNHLYKIFPKLGIASRAALRDALDEAVGHS